MSKKIVIGNWKMNPLSTKEAQGLFHKINKNLKSRKVTVVICPPSVYLAGLKKMSRKIFLGVQNAFWGETGAQTGEVSAEIFSNLGIQYVILGHSERRALGETNEDVNKKIKAALVAGLTPIICLGEKERDIEHKYLNFIQDQIRECLSGITRNNISKIIIAYEPIWAIGKNALREATGEEFREITVFIRKILTDIFGIEAVAGIQIIYGGSVNPKNAEIFLKIGEADGFLVGRDSLNVEKFLKIIEITDHAVN